MRYGKILFCLSILWGSLLISADDSIADRVYEKIQSQPVNLNFDILDFDLAAGVNLNINKGIRVFPNRDIQTFSRSEPISFNLNLGYDIPLGLFSVGARQTNSINGEFIRQFDNYMDALNFFTHPPYIFDSNSLLTVDKIPYTAERAKNLEARDYFRYQVRAAFELSGGLQQELGITSLRAGTSKILYGDFQIEVYKREDNKVLVRASSLKEHKHSLNLSLSSNYILQLFSRDLINRQVTRQFLPSEIARLNLSQQAYGALFAVEYLFDLDDQKAKKAYDQMMNFRNWKFLDVKNVINPFDSSGESALTALQMQIEAPERLSLVDSEKSVSEARVRRLTQSHTSFETQSRGGLINFKLLRMDRNSSLVEQNIRLTTDARNGIDQFYRIASANYNSSRRGWLSFGSRQEIQRQADILFELNNRDEIIDFLELSFSFDVTHASLSRNNKANLSGQVYKMLPGHIHGPGVRDFVDALDKFRGDEVLANLDVLIRKDALALLTRLKRDEIEYIIDAFIDNVFHDQAFSRISQRDYGNLGLRFDSRHQGDQDQCRTHQQRKNCFYEYYQSQISTIKNDLVEILSLSPGDDYEVLWQKLLGLQSQPLFNTLGSGIFTRLIYHAAMKKERDFFDFVTLNLLARSRNHGVVYYKSDEQDLEKSSVLLELIKIRNRILERRFDPSYFEINHN